MLPTPRARRFALVAGGGAVLLVVIIVVLTGGKHGGAATPTTRAKPPMNEPAEPGVVAAVTPAPAPTPLATAPMSTPTPATAPAVTPPTTTPVAPHTPRIARSNKPVVVDYDKTKAPPSPVDHDASLERARAAYATGNRHLFAGETDAAIVAYKQALAAYPNYVAGYRGLGLAYAQQSNSAAAVKAFKTYIGLAPTAKDVELIKKRIARLSAK